MLNYKENNFWTALIKDHHERADKSFLNVLYLGFLQSAEDLKKSLFDMYSNKNTRYFFEKSNLLLETQNGNYIAKYDNYYYIADTEGDIRAVGQEIQNIPAQMIHEEIRELDDIDGLTKYFLEEYGLDYLECIKDYKIFCSLYGLEYQENLKLIKQQSEGFDNLLINKI